MSKKENHLFHKAAVYTITIILFAGSLTSIVNACHTPGIEIIKSGPIFGYVGDKITYKYHVLNTGDVPLWNINVSDDQCGPISYVSGDENENGKLDVGEEWIFTCTYVPGFTFPEPLINNATVTGEWKEKKVQDSDDYTLYPFILRKKVLLYWEGENINYEDPETEFTIKMWKGEDVLDKFTISESSYKKLWLSEGTYQFCEEDLPDGYNSAYDCITFTPGEQYPDWTHINVITFDLSLEKNGPEIVYQGDNVTYYYYVTNGGPASVKPIVEDDICGSPDFTGGDENENGKIDPDETWTFEINYIVIEDCDSLLNNTANVTDEEGQGRSPDHWWLGGDRNLSNNIDDWSVFVMCEREEFDPDPEPENETEPEPEPEPKNETEPEPEPKIEFKSSNKSTVIIHNVSNYPVADANGPYEGNIHEDIEFDGSKSYTPNGTIIQYSWTFGDGKTGTGETVTHAYDIGGKFIVELTVLNDKGKWDINKTTIQVNIPNRPPLTPLISGPSCDTNTKYSYVFGAQDPDNDQIQYHINWGDGSTNQTGFLPSGKLFSMLHSWEQPGQYNITVTASDNEFTSQAKLTVLMEDNNTDNIIIVILGLLALIAFLIAFIYSKKDKKRK